MPKKMLIKVTVDEALYPELYQRLAEFENPRLRAALIRSLANDFLRSASSRVSVSESDLYSPARPAPEDAIQRTVARPVREHGSVVGSTASSTANEAHLIACAIGGDFPDILGGNFADF